MKAGERVFDRYVVEKVLPSGGFGHVYLVQEKGGKRLVMKVPDVKFQSHKEWSRLFTWEAELWIGLGVSPNIVTALDVRLLDGIVCLFTEYIQGGTLGDRMTSSPLDLRFVVRTSMDVANGLAFAWRRARIVHGDLHPENILMSGAGARLTDFGLSYSYRNLVEVVARAMGGEASAQARFPSHLRTPFFLSPEQFSDEIIVDTRSDIYSFGVLLYKLSTGRFPFPRELEDSPDSIRSWHQTGSVIPPVKLRPDLPLELSELIVRCLEKSPDQRYEDFDEVWKALKQMSDICKLTSGYKKITDSLRSEIDEMTRGLGGLLTPRLEEEGLALQELGHHEEALEKFDKSIRVRPREFSTWWNKGNSHFQLGQVVGALESFQYARKLKPKDSEVGLRIGRCLQLLDREVEAINELSDFIRSAPPQDRELSQAHVWRGQIHLLLGKYELADKDFRYAIKLLRLEDLIEPQKEITNAEEFDLLFEHWREQLRCGRPAAVAWFELNRGLSNYFGYLDASFARAPTDPTLLVQQAIAFDKLGRSEMALKFMRTALRLAPRDPEIAIRLAEMLIDSKSSEESGEIVDEVLKQHPNHVPALINKARLVQATDKKAARNYLEKALAIENNNSSVLNNLGALLMNDDPTLASNYLQRALPLNPHSTAPLHNMIIIAKRKKDLDEVLTLCELCLERDPHDSSALLDKSLVLGMRGQMDLAIELASEALALDPDDPLVARAYRALRHFPSRIREIYERTSSEGRIVSR